MTVISPVAVTERTQRATPKPRKLALTGTRAGRREHAILVACLLAVAGVVLQALPLSTGAAITGAALDGSSWVIFGVVTTCQLQAVTDRARWATEHTLDLTILAVACPLWPALLPELMLVELAPALTLLDSIKLAKLVKVGRAAASGAQGRPAYRAIARVTLLVAFGAAVLVIVR
ncbi:hypothetical protein [uncultured Jatrophihabitans sp.]|uniref:hypothetical protein n=1 Tax=uncultured Jatrophihabitans sp. TaxID=1610747 RepID=UPI0035C997CE